MTTNDGDKSVLTTKRLYSRHLTGDDHDILTKLLTPGREAALIDNVGSAVTSQINESINSDDTLFHGQLLLSRKDDNPIGYIRLRKKNINGQQENELQYSLAPTACGRGLMSEALAAFIGKAFAHSKIESIVAVIAFDNRPSFNLIQRFGFSVQQTIASQNKPVLLYRLRKIDFLAMREGKASVHVPRFFIRAALKNNTNTLNKVITLSRLDNDVINNFVKYLNNRNILDNTLAIPYPYTYDDGAWFVEHSKNYTRSVHWAIKLDGEAIGCISIIWREKVNLYELGYWLAEPFWGQGIMSKCAKTVSNYALYGLDQPALFVHHFARNQRSRRVIEKSGFKPLGLIKNYVRKGDEQIDCYAYELGKPGWNYNSTDFYKSAR